MVRVICGLLSFPNPEPGGFISDFTKTTSIHRHPRQGSELGAVVARISEQNHHYILGYLKTIMSLARQEHIIVTSQHPGSTQEEIENEPDWAFESGHHRLGFQNPCGRYAGITHTGDELLHEEPKEVRKAHERIGELKEKVKKGVLVNFRDVIGDQANREVRSFLFWGEWKGGFLRFWTLYIVLRLVGVPSSASGTKTPWLSLCA